MSAPSANAQLFVSAHHRLAEGPLWLGNRWWWVDIESGTIHSCDDRGEEPWGHDFGERVAALAPLDANRFLVAFERRLARWNKESGKLDTIAQLDGEPIENRFNDGKMDPVGRFIVGTLNKQGRRGTAGLYSLDRSDRLTRLLSGLHLSNGLAWSADGRTLFHADSLAYEIAAYDYDCITGRICNRRVAIRVPPEMGVPDGMTIDTAGNLWVAHWGGNAVRCWSPQSGRCLSEIHVPCSQPTSCQFGGPQTDRLIITTARIGISDEALQKQPLAGSIFIATPGVKGLAGSVSSSPIDQGPIR